MEKEELNPYETAGLLSKLTFWWMNPLFNLGSRKTLLEEDICNPRTIDRAETLCAELERNIYESPNSKTGAKEGAKQKHLALALARQFSWDLILTAIGTIIMTAGKFTPPLMVTYLITYFKNPGGGEVSQTDAYVYAVILALSAFINTFIHMMVFYTTSNVGTKVRAAVSALIYKKVLRLSNKTLATVSSGRIVNLISTDVEKFFMGLILIHYTWMAPLLMILVGYILYQEVGISFVSGYIVLVLNIAYQLGLGNMFGKLRFQIAKQTDHRVKVMNEIINGIRVIKMYCWEKPFSKIINEARRNYYPAGTRHP